jgi:hypothetical protein
MLRTKWDDVTNAARRCCHAMSSGMVHFCFMCNKAYYACLCVCVCVCSFSLLFVSSACVVCSWALRVYNITREEKEVHGSVDLFVHTKEKLWTTTVLFLCAFPFSMSVHDCDCVCGRLCVWVSMRAPTLGLWWIISMCTLHVCVCSFVTMTVTVMQCYIWDGALFLAVQENLVCCCCVFVCRLNVLLLCVCMPIECAAAVRLYAHWMCCCCVLAGRYWVARRLPYDSA